MTRLITTLALALTLSAPAFAAGKTADTGREVSSISKTTSSDTSQSDKRDEGTVAYAPAQQTETKKERRPLPHRQGGLEDRSRP